MKDVTPKSNLEILIKCLGIAIGNSDWDCGCDCIVEIGT